MFFDFSCRRMQLCNLHSFNNFTQIHLYHNRRIIQLCNCNKNVEFLMKDNLMGVPVEKGISSRTSPSLDSRKVYFFLPITQISQDQTFSPMPVKLIKHRVLQGKGQGKGDIYFEVIIILAMKLPRSCLAYQTFSTLFQRVRLKIKSMYISIPLIVLPSHYGLPANELLFTVREKGCFYSNRSIPNSFNQSLERQPKKYT